MSRTYARAACALALAVATASFTGSALAGGGNSANAPGQQKQDQSAAQPQASQPTAQSTAKSTAPGQAKKATTHAAKTNVAQSSTAAGTKPSSTTKHWTHTTVGNSPDVSKRYGNGKTAAQIAASRGAPANQPLTGPGNSQPHKTFDCAHKDNKSGGVDVHAIKSYTTNCTQTQSQTESVQVTPQCGQTVITVTKSAPLAATRGKGKKLGLAHGKHLGLTKHQVTAVSTQVVANGQSCSQQQTQQTQQTQQVQQQQQVAAAAANQQATKPSSQAPVSSSAPASQGGVLGAQASLATPKHHSHHGLLGAVAGTTLPFTGFPLWAAVLIALVLLAVGFALRRRAATARL